jgi:hypothetical protein
MPIKGKTKVSESEIADIVKRYNEGEQVTVLAKYYGYSKPGIYRLLAIHRQTESGGQGPFHNQSVESISDPERRALINELMALEEENSRLH